MSYTYALILQNKSEKIPRITFDNICAEYIGLGEIVHGRHFKGKRPNLIINLTQYDLESLQEEHLAKWFSHVKSGLAKNYRIINQ